MPVLAGVTEVAAVGVWGEGRRQLVSGAEGVLRRVWPVYCCE